VTVGSGDNSLRGGRANGDTGIDKMELSVRVTDADSSALAALRVFAGVLARLRHRLDSSGKPWLCVRGKHHTEESA